MALATHRFLVALLPSPAIASEVEQFKALIHDRAGSFHGLHTTPHVTLFFLDASAEVEKELCERLVRGAAPRGSFPVSYHDITHFPDQRTIYMDPVEKGSIAALRLGLLEQVRSMLEIDTALHVTDHPHLTIAAGLKPKQFTAAWALVSPVRIHFSEHVGHVSLLRRSLVPGSRYELIQAFPLNGLQEEGSA